MWILFRELNTNISHHLTQPENFNEVACQNVVSCVRNGTRSEVCYDIFQCMEDQVQPKCQMFTTEGYSLSQDQLQQSCSTYDDVLQQEPSLAQLKSAPLSLVVIKAPTRFDQKNFVMFSVRWVLLSLIFLAQSEKQHLNFW